MAKINKKVINVWDGGIKTSARSSNPETSDGCQMIKGFDVYKDPKKLIPMQDWEDFTTETERAYGIRAMGGISNTVYGLGKGLTNWYGQGWQYRTKIIRNPLLSTGSTPMHFDLSKMPANFWDNVQENGEDIRVTNNLNVTHTCKVENLDIDNQTGDLWISPSAFQGGDTAPTPTTLVSYAGTATLYVSSSYLYDTYKYKMALNFTSSGQTTNILKCTVTKVGNFGKVTPKVYSDNAGSPGTLLYTYQDISYMEVATFGSYTEMTLYSEDFTLPTTGWLVFENDQPYVGTFFGVNITSSGTNTAKSFDGTTWNNISTTMTPNFSFQYADLSGGDYCYLYYGNPNVSAMPDFVSPYQYANQPSDTFSSFNNTRFAFNFGEENPLINRAYVTEEITTSPLYYDGLFGKAIKTPFAPISTLPDDEVCLSGSDISFSFMIYLDSFPPGNVELISNNGYADVTIGVDGTIYWNTNGTAGNATNTSTNKLSLGRWYVVDVAFDHDAYIWIDGVMQTFDINDGDNEVDTPDAKITINTGNYFKIAYVWGYNDNISQTEVTSKYNNFISKRSFSVGSEESKSEIGLQYNGIQFYQKSITSGNWEETQQAGQPVKSMSYYPVNGFIDDSGTYFVCSTGEQNNGFMYLGRVNYLDVIDPTHLELSYLIYPNPSKIIVNQEEALDDSTVYFNYGSSAIGSVGNPGSSSETTMGGTITSLASWRSYLAGAYTRRNRAIIHIWDLATTNPIEKLDAGTGNIRIVGTAGDTLFCVVDNFIDDAVKSANKPTMEIRQYVGNGQTEKTHVIEIPVVVTSYSDDWERAVSSFKIKRNTQTLFYARLPNNEAGTTFDEGFWAIGKNSRGELCLTLQIDTEGLGMPEQVFGFAQQVFFIQKDGNIKRLSDDTYSKVSSFKSLKMNEGNTEIEKHLVGIEIVTEPLEANQIISVYYKVNGDTERTKICDFTGEGEISTEAIYDINGENLRNYKEVEFELESTGGKSAILEFNYRYEYLSDIV